MKINAAVTTVHLNKLVDSEREIKISIMPCIWYLYLNLLISNWETVYIVYIEGDTYYIYGMLQPKLHPPA